MKKSVSRTELSTDYHNKSSLAVPPPELVAAIVEAGTTVRNLKAEKADFKDALQILLNLKTQYKDITGKIYTPPGYKPQRRVCAIYLGGVILLDRSYCELVGVK